MGLPVGSNNSEERKHLSLNSTLNTSVFDYSKHIKKSLVDIWQSQDLGA